MLCMRSEAEELGVLPERLGGAAEPPGLLVGELHVGDAEYTGTTEPGRQAEEHLMVVGDAVEARGEHGHRVDVALVAEDDRIPNRREGEDDEHTRTQWTHDDFVAAKRQRFLVVLLCLNKLLQGN